MLITSSAGRQKFPSALRLHCPAEFQSVLRRDESGTAGRRRQGRGQWFALTARPNALGHCRLGIIAARRVVPLAVSRNRAKRLIREVFRTLHRDLPPLDVVVRVMTEVAERKALSAAREELRTLLMALLR